MNRRVTLAVLLIGMLATEVASAQVLGTPVFRSPYQAFTKTEINGYISDPGDAADVALEGGFRFARKSFDLGLTAGFIDIEPDAAFGIGIDGRMAVLKHSEDIPLDGSLTAGFGALFSDGNSGFSIPFGFSIGRQIELEDSNVSFTPYAHPIIAPWFGDFDDEVLFALGLGVDVALSKAFEIRVSGAIGDYEGVAVGVAWHK
ncbi:MAG: hypothetical protein OEW17_09455 [Gemmatimonadota bacterium]|nr:hypothetical protein [Gemmatimonadota bacterium]MDH4349021.1 hypothetical protein [Gemmatimonadota bacterium]MDH5283216.1 hypothetical protein [Gemmatimonadota bacterium]